MTRQKYNWPTREEWAHRERHPYWDTETGCPFRGKFGHCLSDYASTLEIATAITALEELWRRYGRELRELNRQGSPLYPQANEANEAKYYRRYIAMSDAEKEIAGRPRDLKTYRHGIRKILAAFRDNDLPPYDSWQGGDEACTIIKPFQQRYDSAFEAAKEEWKRECEKIPVGDAEWEAELRRRKEIEEREADDAAHPERFIHSV